ncbi:MAG: hypothetical protein ABSF09_13450 [Candidatus Bathyarchaeia archaeon]|jgi:hypothetical protein
MKFLSFRNKLLLSEFLLAEGLFVSVVGFIVTLIQWHFLGGQLPYYCIPGAGCLLTSSIVGGFFMVGGMVVLMWVTAPYLNSEFKGVNKLVDGALGLSIPFIFMGVLGGLFVMSQVMSQGSVPYLMGGSGFSGERVFWNAIHLPRLGRFFGEWIGRTSGQYFCSRIFGCIHNLTPSLTVLIIAGIFLIHKSVGRIPKGYLPRVVKK